MIRANEMVRLDVLLWLFSACYSVLIVHIHMRVTLGWHVRYNAPTSGETTDVISSLNLPASQSGGVH